MATNQGTVARHVSLTQLSELFGVSRTVVGTWVKKGCPYVQRADREKRIQWLFDTADVLAWREQQAAINAVGDSDTLEIQEARRRKMAAEAALAELNLAKLRGDAVSIDHIEKVWSDIVATFRAKMLVLPARIAPSIAGETNERMIIKSLQVYIHEALDELTQYAVDISEFSDD